MWYFWFCVIFILTSCFGGCGYWRRRQLMLRRPGSLFLSGDMIGMFAMQGRLSGVRNAQYPRALESLYAPGIDPNMLPPSSMPYRNTVSNARSQRSGRYGMGSAHKTETDPIHSLFQAPPAYSEVVFKPPDSNDDLPPLYSREDIIYMSEPGMSRPAADRAAIHISGMSVAVPPITSVPPPYSPPILVCNTLGMRTDSPCPAYTATAATTPPNTAQQVSMLSLAAPDTGLPTTVPTTVPSESHRTAQLPPATVSQTERQSSSQAHLQHETEPSERTLSQGQARQVTSSESYV